MSSRQDLHERITSCIVASLEAGERPWIKPWAVAGPATSITRPLRHNGTPYRGINVLVLWHEAVERGYMSSVWVTFKQALELGACVRKGEHGTHVFYMDRFTRTAIDDAGDEVEKQIPFMRAYTVFNTEQIDGLPERLAGPMPARSKLPERFARADAFFENVGAHTVHGGSEAYYLPACDRIHVPCMSAFKAVESYYGTRAHECIHWTKHGSRLGRDFGSKRWGDDGYAVEELVAELGAAFLCADLDLSAEPRADHAAYLASWLRVLKADNRAIFSAASHAQRACDYLHAMQPPSDDEDVQTASRLEMSALAA